MVVVVVGWLLFLLLLLKHLVDVREPVTSEESVRRRNCRERLREDTRRFVHGRPALHMSLPL